MAATISAPGSNRITADSLIGQSIEDIRESDWADSLNIPEGASVTVNGRAETDDYVIQDCDVVVFSRPVGQKG